MDYSGGRVLLSSQREGQATHYSPRVLIFVPLAAILFQVYVPQFFEFLHFLELPMLVVVYFALMRRCLNTTARMLSGSLLQASRSLSRPTSWWWSLRTWWMSMPRRGPR